ncbi:MAG: glycosyltransferase family 87 protein [Candidatus Korobacteraceae bacterium]|jgi:hypothetical protein
MRLRVSGTGLVIVAVSFCFWGMLGAPILIDAYHFGEGINDFLCYYIGGTLAREGHFADLYRPAAQIQVQERVAPSVKGPRAYIRPPWFALALAPLTSLPLLRAYTIWVGVMFTILLGTWAWGTAWFGEPALLLAALFLPANLGFCFGQDCAAMLAVLCVFFMLSEREKPFLAGMALGVGLIKPHLLLLFPVWMLLQKRWRMLAGFAAVAATLLATAVLILGTSGVASYLDLLLHGNTEIGGRSPQTMLNIYSLPVNFGIESRPLNALLAVSIVGLAVFGVRRAPVWRAICIASTGSLLISPHVFGYDAALLLLPIWLVMANFTSNLSRYSALVLCAPVTFLSTLAIRPFPCIPALALFVFFVALVADTAEQKVLQAKPIATVGFLGPI